MRKVSDSTTSIVGIVAETRGELAEPFEEVVVEDGKVLQIGTCLAPKVREGLISFP